MAQLLDRKKKPAAPGKTSRNLATKAHRAKISAGSNLAHLQIPQLHVVPQGSLALKTVITPLPGNATEVVTCTAQPLAKAVGPTLAKKIGGNLRDVMRELEQKKLGLALVSLDEIKAAPVVSQIQPAQVSAENEAWDPFEEGRRAIEALKEAGGGHLDRTEAAQRLDLRLAQLYNRIDQKKLVVWTDAAGRYRFPKWQFGANGMLAGISECLQILADSDPWAIMRFFLTPSHAGRDKSPLDLLRAGKIAEATEIAAAQANHA